MPSIGTTPGVISGLLVTDPRFKWSAYDSASTVTQAGPLPGVPEAQDDTELVLEAVGDQTAELSIATVRAGHPGTDKAQFVWQYATDASDKWRGWDPPVSLTGFEFIDYSTTAGMWNNFHARTLDDGTIIVVADKQRRYVICWTRDPDTGVWTDEEVYDRGSTQTHSSFPCVVVLPTGRVMAFFWVESSSGTYNIRNYYSDNGGASWLPGQKGCLENDVDTSDYEPGWIRGDYLDGQLMFIVHMEEQATPEDRFFQYASNDHGATFDEILEWDGKDHRYVDVLAHDGRFFIAYIADSDGGATATYAPYLRVIGGAYEAFTSGEPILMQSSGDTMEWATQSGGLYNDGNISLWADEDGVLWVMGREHASGANANHELAVRASFDGGETWAEVGGGPADHQGASTWRGMDDSTYPTAFACVAHRGRTAVIHRAEANPGTADDSAMCMWLGGYTTVCLPQETGKGRTSPRTVTSWTDTWLPYDTPENTGTIWTASSTGTAVLGPSGLALATGNPETELRLANNLPGTLAEGVTVLAECQLVDNQCRVTIRWNDSVSEEYEVALLVDETKITLWDLVDGAEIGHFDTTDAVTGYVQLLADCYNNNAVLYYRVVDASGAREWTKVAETSSCLDNGAISAPGHRVQFGQYDDSVSYWRMVCINTDSYTGQHIYGQDNFGDLLGRAYMPTPVYVDGGTSIQAIDGPTMRNEDWTITPRAEYPVSNVFADVAASPRRKWRSTSDAADEKIMVDLVGSANTTAPMGSLIACYLGGANFRTAYLEGSNAAGNAWTRLINIDLGTGTLRWTRSDRIVQPDTSGGSSVGYYLPTDILKGCRVKFDSGDVRKVTTNSAGVWKTNSSTLQTRILLDEVDGTEGASGTAGELWMKDGLFVVATTGTFRKYRLFIPAQTTAEGYFELGVWQLGHFFPTGGYLMGSNWGRAQEWATKVEQVEGRSGIRSVQALEPTRRAVEFAYVDGVETSNLYGQDPNYIIGWTGGNAVCVPADAPWSVPGLTSQLQGAKTPVTYCAALKVPSGTGSGNAEAILDPRLLLYGRVVTESLRADTVLGDAGKNELIRLGVVRIEEEPG